MLTRQWQFGEFSGEDAASPLTARMRIATIAPASFRCGRRRIQIRSRNDAAQTRIEREPIPVTLRALADGRGLQRRAVRGALGKTTVAAAEGRGLDGHYGCTLTSFHSGSARPACPGNAPPGGGCGGGVIAASVAGRIADGVAFGIGGAGCA